MGHSKAIIIVVIGVLLLSTILISQGNRVDSAWKGENVETLGASWDYEADTSKSGGYGECIGGDGKYVYILREYSASYAPYLWRYDPESGDMVELNASLPKGTFKNGAAMAYDYQGNFYFLTGGAYADGADRVQFLKFNLSTETWYNLSSTPHVQGAGDAIVYSGYDGMLYAFLGRAHYTGDYSPPDSTYSIFARYDPNTDTWENLSFPSWPGTDDGASLAWTGGRYIYALEGEFDENAPITSFARYDIETDTWENMSDIPAPDGVGDGGSLLWIGAYDSSYSNIIYALDGNGCNETPGYNFTAYYINNDTWVHLEQLPYPIGYYVGNRLAYAQGKIFYWQGAPSSWDGDGTKVYSWDPTETVPEFSSWLAPLMILGIFVAVGLRRRA